MRLRLTERSYHYLIDDSNLSKLLASPVYKLDIAEEDGKQYLQYEDDPQTVSFLLDISRILYSNLSDEKNVWVDASSEYCINDIEAIREILIPFENRTFHSYPLFRYRLSNTIKKNKIVTIDQLKQLDKDPFSSILPLGGSDYKVLFWNSKRKNNEDNKMSFDHPQLIVNNRHISEDFDVNGGTVSFENCIIEGNITVSGADYLSLSQCIILGKVWITATKEVHLNFSNIEQVLMYNCRLEVLKIEYCKIYRMVFHSSSVDNLFFIKNRFIEPYIAAVDFPEGTRLDMEQFAANSISHKTVRKIEKTERPSIPHRDEFFLTYAFDLPDRTVTSADISFEMADIILKYGDLDKDHNTYANMMYEKAYNTNTGWRRFLVVVTGAFYKPLRWGFYLIISTLLFTLLYTCIPSIKFTYILSGDRVSLDIWTALYYSTCQIIGTNPTMYTPTGVTQILTTVQSLANTLFIVNMAGSFVRKYFRGDLI